jgi:large subunit ribosomal protein L13e
LILFPRRVGQHKTHDSKKEELKAENTVRHIGAALPIKNVITKEGAYSERKIKDMGKGEPDAYKRLRQARSEARLVGVREKRAKAKADEAQAAKK